MLLSEGSVASLAGQATSRRWCHLSSTQAHSPHFNSDVQLNRIPAVLPRGGTAECEPKRTVPDTRGNSGTSSSYASSAAPTISSARIRRNRPEEARKSLCSTPYCHRTQQMAIMNLYGPAAVSLAFAATPSEDNSCPPIQILRSRQWTPWQQPDPRSNRP